MYRGAETGFDRAVSLGVYRGQLTSWIRQLKYDQRTELAQPLGSLLAWAVQARLPWPARQDTRSLVVIPVPLHPSRLAERGFNQAGLLAASLAGALNLELRLDILERTGPGSPQASLNRQQRLRALENAFAVTGRFAGPGTWDALLVDDVLTTGATLDACAVALKAAGARQVSAAVLAAGIPQRLWVDS